MLQMCFVLLQLVVLNPGDTNPKHSLCVDKLEQLNLDTCVNVTALFCFVTACSVKPWRYKP